jgi:hypothetical protein
MRQRAFWITLAIILFYLIARPRIGTVWYVNLPPDQPLPSGATLTAPSPEWKTVTSPPGFGDKPPSGFVPDTPPPVPTRAFTEESDCGYALGAFRQESGRADAYCDSRYALLWGW